jgi:four helix bundle protein
MNFIAYEVALELLGALAEPVGRIARCDPSLADQLRRASQSVVLCIAEGAQRVGRDRLHLYRVAAGSAAEVRAGLAIAKAWTYVAASELARVEALLDRVIALLWRLTHRKAA